MRTILMLAVLTFASALSARTWTSTDGRTIEGELIAKTADTAVIQRDDATTVNVPLTLLSPADQAFVKKTKVDAPAPSMKEALAKFFTKNRMNGSAYTIDGVINGGDKYLRAQITQLGSWGAEIKQLESLSKDSAADKMLLIDMRRTQDALTKAAADKSQAAEALRSLASLKASANR